MNKTPPARPNLGFTICHLSLFFLGFRGLRGHPYFKPSGQCFSKCWSNLSDVRRPLGNHGLCQPDVLLIRCALRTRYVQLLSGFVGTAGGLAGLVLPLSRMSCNRDSESNRVFLGEGISSLIARAYHRLSWDTPAGFKLSKAVPVVMGRWEFVNVWL